MLPRLLAALAVAAALMPAAASAADRYALAGGCYTATGVAGAEQVRLQATALGRYLLYTKDGKFLTAGADGTLAPAADPSPAADFELAEAGEQFTLAPQSTKQVIATVSFAPADGCAEFPEAGLQAEGTPSKGATEYGRVGGIVEGHNHWMAWGSFGGRFRCGQPWHQYGITRALPDCEERYGPQGSTAPVQNTLGYGNPARVGPTGNWPDFPNQSRDNLIYEGEYYRWVERVYMAGMRLMVMGVNENRVLCELLVDRAVDCNEMNGIRRGFNAMKEFEDYVDAQNGGPGKGWFQIVTDPFEARKVINQGRMAVVLEIETSEPFDCIGWETSTCDKAQIDAQIDEMHAMGVRSSLLLNKYDNPLSGVRFDSGVASYLINAGNKQSAGSFWDAKTCTGPLHDNTIDFGDANIASFLNGIFTPLGFPSSSVPQYPPAPHCNTRGLTELGRHAIRRMMKLGWIVNPDHMSQAAVDDTLTLLESEDYSGVISPHGWMDPGNYPRLWKLGGTVFTGHSGTDSYVEEWQDYNPRETPYESGWGFGADLGGLSNQPDKAKDGAITYPFKSYDGKVTFERQKTGERTFDFTKEGVAHFGLYADWLEDLRRVGGQDMADDMWQGAEAYLQMWERASGIESKGCFRRHGRLKASGRGQIRLGDDWQSLLERAGQPQQRNRAWSWCVRGKNNRRAADVAVLSKAGNVQLVGSTANKRFAGGVEVGEPAVGAGTVVRRKGDRAYVHVVRDGRVRAIAVTTTTLAGNRAALRAAMRRVLSAKASNRKRRFVPSKAQAEGRMLGRSLAGSSNAVVNQRLALYCQLNL